MLKRSKVILASSMAFDISSSLAISTFSSIRAEGQPWNVRISFHSVLSYALLSVKLKLELLGLGGAEPFGLLEV